jgi:hypothetical protein
MAHKTFVQQVAQHILRAAAEVGTKTIGEQESGTSGYRTGKTGSACWVKLMGASSGFGLSLDSNFFRQ